MAFWSDKYVGIPFVEEGRGFDGCDCAGLAELVLREEKGVRVARIGHEYARRDFKGKKGLRGLETALRKHLLAEWPQAVTEPQPFDGVIFAMDGIECHVGIYVGDGRFLHVEKNGLFAKIDELSDPQWAKCFVEFRRHKSLGGGGAPANGAPASYNGEPANAGGKPAGRVLANCVPTSCAPADCAPTSCDKISEHGGAA